METLQIVGFIITIFLLFYSSSGKWEFTLKFWALFALVGIFGLNAFVLIPSIILIPFLIISLIQWKKRVSIKGAWNEYYEDIYDDVWDRDGGECVKCGKNTDLEFDLIQDPQNRVPDIDNFQLICQICQKKIQ